MTCLDYSPSPSSQYSILYFFMDNVWPTTVTEKAAAAFVSEEFFFHQSVCLCVNSIHLLSSRTTLSMCIASEWEHYVMFLGIQQQQQQKHNGQTCNTFWEKVASGHSVMWCKCQGLEMPWTYWMWNMKNFMIFFWKFWRTLNFWNIFERYFEYFFLIFLNSLNIFGTIKQF
jgi:hypothetical protein